MRAMGGVEFEGGRKLSEEEGNLAAAAVRTFQTMPAILLDQFGEGLRRGDDIG